MKAVICTKYGSPEVLKIKEVKKPVPKDDEILIKIYAATVGASDPVMRKGEPFIARLFSGLTKPKMAIPGTEFSGIVEETGKGVTLFKKGDKVYGGTDVKLGAHAEYLCISENSAVALKPENINFAEAAAIGDGALTALHFLRDKGKIKSGQKILINGASGSVGISAVQLSKIFDAEVTGVCSTSNIDLVRSNGADKVIDYTKKDFTENGEKYDIIFDAVAKSSFSRCKDSLKDGGVYLTTFPSLLILLRMLFTSKSKGKKALTGASGLRPADVKVKDMIYLKGLMEEGKVKSVIDKEYKMEQIAEAHMYVETGHKKGNVVISMI